MSTTEIEVRQPRPQANAAALPAKIEYARELANSGLLPAAYRKQPGNILYAVEYGEMLGLAPMAAITGVHVIEGKPTASAGLAWIVSWMRSTNAASCVLVASANTPMPIAPPSTSAVMAPGRSGTARNGRVNARRTGIKPPAAAR